jgi:protein ImuB
VFGALLAAEGTDPDVVVAIAREFSPRIEVPAGDAAGPEVVLDLRGLERLFGDARTVAAELRRDAADRGVRVRVAIAGTRTAARLLVRHRAGVTVIEPSHEAAAVAPLPLALLEAVRSVRRPPSPGLQRAGQPDPRTGDDPPIDTLRRWGLRTLGDLAALPADELAVRLGQAGVRWQALARGEDPRPLIPACPEERFEQTIELEWPIDGLEPLSFVLGRLMEPLSAHLERRDRGAAVLHVRLRLVDRTMHERSLQLPAPMRDARTLRTLALLDLESHPPGAAIDRVTVAVDPTPGRVVQFSLLTRPLPSPERVSTLMARLTALMGEGRCGAPAAVDTWQPGAFAMVPFAPSEARDSQFAANDSHSRDDTPRRRGTEDSSFSQGAGPVQESLGASVPRCVVPEVHDVANVALALRRFRVPVPARVAIEDGQPVRVVTDRRGVTGGRVAICAGPWRTSGGWWMKDATDGKPPSPLSHPACWDRDEWDVALSDGATYRVFRERDTDRWYVEGILD